MVAEFNYGSLARLGSETTAPFAVANRGSNLITITTLADCIGQLKQIQHTTQTDPLHLVNRQNFLRLAVITWVKIAHVHDPCSILRNNHYRGHTTPGPKKIIYKTTLHIVATATLAVELIATASDASSGTRDQ